MVFNFYFYQVAFHRKATGDCPISKKMVLLNS